MRQRTHFKLKSSALGSALLLAMSPLAAFAEDISETTGLVDYALGSVNHQPLSDYGVTWGGWLNTSVTANANAPADKFNGPVTFGDRSGELQMNQFYGYLQRAITVGADDFDIGGRVDVMYGTDSIFTQAYGVPVTNPRTGLPENRGNYDLHLTSWSQRFYALALPQAYIEMNLPVGNGLSVKAGHFYTPVGYEVVTAPDNFFFTHAYTFQYGEPFTHTGILGNYAFDDNWSVMAGTVTGSATGGWDGNFNTNLSNWDFIGGATWTSDDKAYSLNLTSTAGAASATDSNPWAIYSLVGKGNWLDNTLHYVIQHDQGFANNVITAAGQKNAQWYGLNQYIMYDIEDNLGIGLRAEWWRDQDGFRLNSGPGRCGAATNYGVINGNAAGTPGSFACSAQNMQAYGATMFNGLGASYYEITGGLNYKPLKWVTVRPNARYDFATINAFMNSSGKMIDYQFTFSTDLIITF
jgi:Putative beta-barrel porin-2, OmpL-like. bbp2